MPLPIQSPRGDLLNLAGADVPQQSNEGGPFQIFNDDKIKWEAGTASGGNCSGLGGFAARAGFSNGTLDPETSFELIGSAVNGDFLDGGPNSLISNRLNSAVDGRYVFNARNGGFGSGTVPEPASLDVFGIGAFIAGFGVTRRRRREQKQAATA